MARIPVGDFGNALPRGGTTPTASAGQIDGGLSDAGQRLGAVAMGIADQRMAEAARAERQAEAEAKATREAADRAKAAISLTTIENDLDLIGDEVSEGVRTGKVDKTQAAEEFQRRAQERVDTGMADIPQAHAGQVQAAVVGRMGRLGRGVSRAVTQRDQTDVLAGLDATLETAQRLYLTDPARADAMVKTALEAQGPYSGLNAAQLQAKGQAWREGTRLNKAQTLLTAARRDNAALDKFEQALASDEFADLDPSRKTALLNQVEGFRVSNIQRAEAAARQAQAQQERYLRNAAAEFDGAQALITQGKVLSPEYIERVTRATRGTPYAAALSESLKQAPERTAFGVQPLAVQQEVLNQARAQLNTQGTNPEAEKRLNNLQKVYDQARRDYAEEPLQAALERGVIQQIAPINTQNMAGLVQTIGARVEQASLTAQQTGGVVSPLLRQEAEQVGNMINVLPVEQRASAIAQLSQVLGPQQAAALGRQIGPKDKALGIAFGLSGTKTTAGRYTSELVLRGAQAMKDKAVKPDNTAVTGIRARVAAEIGDAYPTMDVRETMIEAAVLAEYGLQSESSGDLQRAVRLVTGGITERGGRKVPLPYGMDASVFDQRLKALTPVDIKTGQVLINGVTVSAYDFLGQIGNAPLVVRGEGRYAVQAGDSLVMRPDGKPLILEIR